MKIKNKTAILLVGLFFFPLLSFGQSKFCNMFLKIKWPEKLWVVTHPFSAINAYHVTTEIEKKKQIWKRNNLLDGDEGGGQLDALRHIYWMAKLGQEIPIISARKLGKAHEKSNEITFKRNLDKYYLANDEKSSKMDLLNNEIGLNLAKKYPNMSSDSLINHIKKIILDGKAFIIKKNHNAEFLDKKDVPIPKNKLIGKWKNPKVIVPSNYVRPE